MKATAQVMRSRNNGKHAEVTRQVGVLRPRAASYSRSKLAKRAPQRSCLPAGIWRKHSKFQISSAAGSVVKLLGEAAGQMRGTNKRATKIFQEFQG
jgi:hypothetical protein